MLCLYLQKLLQDKTTGVVSHAENDDRSRLVPATKDQKSSSARDEIAAKYAAMRENFHKANTSGGPASTPYRPTSTADNGRLRSTNPFAEANGKSTGLKNTWGNPTSGGLDMEANMVGKRFAPLRNFEDREPNKPPSSADTLDNIFQGLKRKPDNGDDMDLLR